jgi:hypothetical protein
MKVHQVELEIERSGIEAEGKFKMKATAKAFDILSSALYSDKILAVIRELSCNAYDSHVAAGKQNVPIEIHLPTMYEPKFYVKDFGTGLSHEDVMEMYTTYFDSSKTESDEYIGQLGLGSKSPFSYSTTFLVASRFNGTLRQYTCFKDENNMPSIALLGEEPTEVCNGLQVTLAVRTSDCEKFLTAARKALMYFDPVPDVKGVTGFRPYSMTHTVRSEDWRIRDTEYWAGMSGAHVVQGFVTYPVDAEQLTAQGMSAVASAIAATDIDMYVPIGKVETAASREALSYDKRTVTNLIGVFEKAAAEMRQSFQKEFDACTTQWQAASLLDRLGNSGGDKFKALFKKFHKEQPFTWNGEEVSTEIVLKLDAIKETQVIRQGVTRRRSSTKTVINSTWHPATSSALHVFNLQANTFVVFDDMPKNAVETLRTWISNRPQEGGRAASAIVLRPVTKTQYNQAEMDAIVDALGGPPAIKVSAMPQVVRHTNRSSSSEHSSRSRRKKTEKLVWNGFRTSERPGQRKFSYLTWETKEIDLNAGGFYVEIERHSVLSQHGVDGVYMQEIVKLGRALGYIDEDVDIVGLTRKDLETIDPTIWTNAFEWVKSEFLRNNANGELLSRQIADSVFSAIGHHVLTFFVKPWDKVEPKLVDGPFKRMIQELVELEATAGKFRSHDVATLMQVFRQAAPPTVAERIQAIQKKWETVVKKYEMLQYINMRYYLNNDSFKTIVNYINLVDSQQKSADSQQSQQEGTA